MKKIISLIFIAVTVLSCSDLFDPSNAEEPIVLTKVGEEIVDGSKAAAATQIVNKLTADISFSIDFNRPFAYFITENSTGAILFAGVQREF